MKVYPKHCVDCDNGIYEPVVIHFKDVDQNGVEITVPNIEILRCNACGTELIPAAASRQISAVMAEVNDKLMDQSKPKNQRTKGANMNKEQNKQIGVWNE